MYDIVQRFIILCIVLITLNQELIFKDYIDFFLDILLPKLKWLLLEQSVVCSCTLEFTYNTYSSKRHNCFDNSITLLSRLK